MACSNADLWSCDETSFISKLWNMKFGHLNCICNLSVHQTATQKASYFDVKNQVFFSQEAEKLWRFLLVIDNVHCSPVLWNVYSCVYEVGNEKVGWNTIKYPKHAVRTWNHWTQELGFFYIGPDCSYCTFSLNQPVTLWIDQASEAENVFTKELRLALFRNFTICESAIPSPMQNCVESIHSLKWIIVRHTCERMVQLY